MNRVQMAFFFLLCHYFRGVIKIKKVASKGLIETIFLICFNFGRIIDKSV